MQVRHLSYFVTLAREGHFAKAAAACNITQPTLSAAIRKLEDDLNVRLVMRGHRFVGLTPEGETLLAWGQQILTDYQSLRDDLSALKQGLAGTLRLGVIPVAMPTVGLVTAHFCAAHPAAKVEIRTMSTQAIADGIARFEIDGGMTYLEEAPPQSLRHVALYQERYVVVTCPSNPIAQQKTIPWAQALDLRLCLLSPELRQRRVIDQVAASLGLDVRPGMTANSLDAVCAHVLRGDWVSILPHTVLYLFGRSADLVAIDLVEPTHSQAMGLAISSRDPPAPMAGALLSALRNTNLQAELDNYVASCWARTTD